MLLVGLCFWVNVYFGGLVSFLLARLRFVSSVYGCITWVPALNPELPFLLRVET